MEHDSMIMYSNFSRGREVEMAMSITKHNIAAYVNLMYFGPIATASS